MGVVCFAAACFYFYEACSVKNLSYKSVLVSFGGTFNRSLIGTFPAYEVLFIIGCIMMFVTLFARRKKYQYEIIKTFLITLELIVLGVLGAKILYVLENIDTILSKGFKITFGGLSFFGALIIIPVVYILLNLIKKYNYKKRLDFCAPAGLVMIAFMRIGCFLKGCCSGIQIWINSNPVIIPAQLIECCFDFFLLDYILTLERKNKYEGYRYAVFLMIYSTYRFFLEYIRKTFTFVWHFTNGQFFSVICFIICFTIIFLKRRKNNEQKTF